MLDEPTTSLTSRDTEILFDIIRKIKEENKAIIFISHKLEEIFLLANVITVFRNGKKVAFSPHKGCRYKLGHPADDRSRSGSESAVLFYKGVG